ncbi:MAG: M48 family metallopeptidase [Azonexus sp.]|jgi:predicted metal-dependent hydrolase|uniref:M48 family metallopeptidase n=1 Tax=Azonexus sp. TaxID=1872668 RepID=UPI002825E60C|nr:SprT family zinc-dependent metalloprotease [Azonexus sp.]MDR0775960.1 M48 family metallopeptidase [Azonexus sp.]
MSSTTPPETGQHIELAGQSIAYRLRRSRRRTIGLTIDQRGLRVGAPLRARHDDIETLIRRHGQWVLDKLAAWRERPAPAPLAVSDGCVLTLLGRPVTIAVTPGTRARWQWREDGLQLSPSPATDAHALLEKALRSEARTVFAERLARYAPLLGVTVPPLRLSSARTRWGSCSTRGGIALNWRLIFLPLPLVDYVVCHELAHLKEMNHGPRFWSLVEQLYPDWRTRRRELRLKSPEIPVIAPPEQTTSY